MQRTSRWLKAGLAVLALAVAAGCATMPGGIAPSNVPLDGKEYTQLGLTSGKDSLIRLFCIVPVSGSNSIRSAGQSKSTCVVPSSVNTPESGSCCAATAEQNTTAAARVTLRRIMTVSS